MPNLLTPAELAAIVKTALKKSNAWRGDPDDSFCGWEENTTQLEDALVAIKNHIAALEARTPAPAKLAHCQCAECKPWLDAGKPATNHRRAPCSVAGERSEDMNNDALIKEARAIDKTREHWPLVKRLANALTATHARVAQAEAERDAALKRMDIAERERDTAVARLHAAEDLVVKNAIERDAYKQSADGAGVVICRIKAERDAARTQLAALRKEAAEAIEAAYREGSNDGVFNENDNTSKPGRFFCDSRARRAAQRIGGAE